MDKPEENSKPKTDPGKNLQKTNLIAQYENRLEDAIADAQYMMIYAATNCPNQIGKDIIKKLISLRQIFENNGKLSADQEVEFWDNYQRLWRLIQPTSGKDFIVTAESIKANMPLKKTFFGWLLGLIPAFSRWTEDWTISKAHRMVNRYIIFTGVVLFILLAFQIYWVIGNRLFVQINDLIKAEEVLKVRATENPQIDLKKEFDSLESQLVQTSILFLNWSGPWKQLTIDGEFALGSESDSQLSNIDKRIKEIDLQLELDPEGMEAAKTSEAGLAAQIAAATKKSQEKAKDEIENKLNLVKKKGTIETILASLNEKEATIQSQKDLRISEKSSFEQELTRLEDEKKLVQAELMDQKDALSQELDDISQKLATFTSTAVPTGVPEATEVSSSTEVAPVTGEPPTTETAERLQLETQRESIQAQIKFIDNLSSSSPDFESAAVIQNSALGAQVKQLSYIIARQSYINGQLENIRSELESVDPPTAEDLDELSRLLTNTEWDNNRLQESIDTITDPTLTLQKQLTGLIAVEDLLQAKIEALQVQINSVDVASIESPELRIVADKIVAELKQEKQQLVEEREKLRRQAQVESIREDSRPAQIAGQFVLDILQEYLLPLLYGILGASIYVLRSLSRHISNVTYSDVSGIRHMVHIALGALSGILVGWFSFLITSNNVIGSVSPLAIAFLVGYNIELVFTKMDEIVVTKLREIRQRTSLTPEEENQIEVPPGTLADEPAQNPSSGSVSAPQAPSPK